MNLDNKVKPEGVCKHERIVSLDMLPPILTCLDCGKNLSKPEGVGEWLDNDMFLKQWTAEKGANQELIDYVKYLLLQEKAKWKGEIVKNIKDKMCLLGNTNDYTKARDAISHLMYKDNPPHDNDSVLISVRAKIDGFAEVLTLIDKL
jgi:hypothetical protein